MYKYHEFVNYLVEKGLIPASDIYNYRTDELEMEFENFFQFCMTNLKTRCEKYNIQPATLFYARDLSVNAGATLIKLDYVIKINMGTMVMMYPFFTEPGFDFSSETFKRFEVIDKHCDVSPEYLMFQLATKFTYYHELAHLIQKSPTLKHGFVENYDYGSSDSYSLERHVLEIDADLWGAHFVCYHVIEYFKKQKEDFKTNDNLVSLFVLGLSSILSYFVFLSGNKYELYFKEFTHPHQSIRISYITDAFLSIAHDEFKQEFHFEKKSILAESFAVSEQLFALKNTGINNVRLFLKELYNSMTKVQEYIAEMRLEIAERPYLLLNNYNRLLP